MKKFISYFLSIQSPVTFLLGVLIGGHYVGVDQFGNKYYRGKARRNYNHERRWVVYKSGDSQASQVPPEYHGWLHHQTNTFPDGQNGYRRPWQKEYTPNLTGTTLAYVPDGHQLKGGQRQKATGDYQPWTPDL